MSRRVSIAFTIGLFCLTLAASARAEVFQWAVTVKGIDDKPIEAFLWVPPGADRIRGALVGGDVLFESAFVKDPDIRQACAQEKLAIVQFVPSLDAIFDYNKPGFQGPERFEQAMKALAEKSGYKELAVAPIFTYGHSVSTMWACHVATCFPDRTFGILSFKGGVDSSTQPEKYASIPLLAIKGEFEEFGPAGPLRRDKGEDRTTSWTVMRETLVGLRATSDANLMSGLLEPGATHFRWSPDYAPYVAMFIRKAAQRRIPGDWPLDAKEVKCLPIDPTTGALSSSDVFSTTRPAAAAYRDYTGDRKQAFWHMDLELAKATDAFYTGKLGKKPQFVTFADPKSGKLQEVGTDLRLNFPFEWIGPDTLRVAATFRETAPSFYPPVSEPAAHAQGPVKVIPYTGVFEEVAPNQFRPKVNGRKLKIEQDKDGNTVINIRGDLIAVHDGDATFRHAEQMGRGKIGSPKGKAQTITFAPLPATVPASAAPIALAATSTSGLPVRFYVASGPADIDADNLLKIQDVPARGNAFEVKVVAWQYGSQIEPKFAPAPPVTQTILVTK